MNRGDTVRSEETHRWDETLDWQIESASFRKIRIYSCVLIFTLNNTLPCYDIKLDPAVLPLLTSFGGLVAGRASGRKKLFLQNMTSGAHSLLVEFARRVLCFFLSLFSA